MARRDSRATAAPPSAPAEKTPPAPATPQVRERFGRLRHWYRTTERHNRILFWLALLVILILLIELAVQLGLSVHSIKSDDLVLYVNAPADALTLEHGEAATLSFTVGTSNLPLCQAICSWTISNVGTKETLAQGADTFSTGDTRQYSAVVAAQPGARTDSYQFLIRCSAESGSYCKSTAKDHAAAVVTVVTSAYTASESAAVQVLLDSLPDWSARTATTLAQLSGIGAVSDPRAASVARVAQDEYRVLLQRYSAVQQSLRQYDVQSAAAAMSADSVSAPAAYEQLAALEKTVAANLSSLNESQATLDALSLVLDAQERSVVRNAIAALPLSARAFSSRSLSDTAGALTSYTGVVQQLASYYAPLVQERAARGQLLAAQEQRAACTLKAGPCPAEPQPIDSLDAAGVALRDACAALQSNETFAAAQAAYLAELDPNATQTELEITFNVSAVRARADFANFSQDVRSAAANGTLLTTDTAERLAVPLLHDAASEAFVAEACNQTAVALTAPVVSLTPTLPVLPTAAVSLPPLQVPAPVCCSAAGCAACAEPSLPVLFVHGHSFSASTTPEYSVSAFVPIALALQDDGFTYLGSVFPREDTATIPLGEYGGVSRPLLTTTYYYDSYLEEGEQSLIAQKSENLETYAIRLKEAVDVTKQKTGQQKVVLVAHSMGGLVARRYLQLFGEDSVSALVLIGTPNFGINGTTLQLCPLFGGDKECQDMAQGSVFLTKLNAARPPGIPVYVIAGTGCDGRGYDGVVDTANVLLPWAKNTIVNGTCAGTSDLLHLSLLDPQRHPELTAQVEQIIARYSARTS